MNKFERQTRRSAAKRSLPAAIAAELPAIPPQATTVSEAPKIAQPAPLTPAEVRTILMSLLLTMFLAALDQTIVATALPTMAREFGVRAPSMSTALTSYLLALAIFIPASASR